MKKILLMLPLLLPVLTGCRYDDTELQKALDDHAVRLEAVAAMRSGRINDGIASLGNLVQAVQEADGIVSLTTTEDGYVITFKSGKTITITNGTDGTDADAPVIGVKMDTDGVFYWTIGGEWLLDTAGRKIPVSATGGEDAVSPQVKVDDEGNWSVSYDGGKTWIPVGKNEAEPPVGDNIFKGVTVDEENVYFTLADDTVLTIPLVLDNDKLMLVFDDQVFAKMTAGQTLSTGYTVLADPAATVRLASFEDLDWKVVITPADATTGTISITAPDPMHAGTIIFVLNDNLGGSWTKAIRIAEEESSGSDPGTPGGGSSDEGPLSPGGGSSIDVPDTPSVPEDPGVDPVPSAPGWMELPASTNSGVITIHSVGDVRNYSLSWNSTALVPEWVAYPLNDGLIGTGSRTNAWGYDPNLPASQQPLLSSSYRNGDQAYSRGHMVVSADRLKDGFNQQTFYYTNMSPMIQNGFNGSIWNDLEDRTRTWSRNCDTLYVVIGTVTDGATGYTYDLEGKRVTVPKAFWKAVLAYDKSGKTGHDGWRACAFYLDHKDYGTKAKMSDAYVLSVDALEAKIGLDLFASLPDAAGKQVSADVEKEDPKQVTWWGLPSSQ